jgi:hypothetical protein
LSAKTTDKPPDVPAKRDTRKEAAAESGLPESKLRAVAALKKSSPDKVQEVRAGKTSLREATKQSKPHLAPAILTVKELRDWWNSCEDGVINVIPRKKPLVGTVDLHFCAIDPTTAKKLAEFYLRLKKTQ